MKRLLFYALGTFVFSTLVAIVIHVLTRSETPFVLELIHAQCIGWSCFLITAAIVPTKQPRWLLAIIAVIGSVAFGTWLAYQLTGIPLVDVSDYLYNVGIGTFFAFSATIVVILVERVLLEIQQRKLLHSENERREVEAQLKLLQAQIEPHFLFNTLANVSSLIERDPALAKRLLERLIEWLRIALARARSERATLGDELGMLGNLLEIMTVRFGERLRWHIDAAPELQQLSFPPMLLQPLVENALRHGIEPKIGGGEIRIRASRTGEDLCVEVADTGNGLLEGPGSGTGLTNIRARLAALFGEAGRLNLTINDAGGVTATLTLPAQETSS